MRTLLAVCLTFCMLFGVVRMSSPTARATEVEDPMAEEAMSEDDETRIIQSAEKIRYAEVATKQGTLNMRAEPGDTAKVIYKLPRYSIVRILGDHGDWAQVLYKSRTGYVQTAYLAEIVAFAYNPITKDDEGETVLAFKRAMYKLNYLKEDELNRRFDAAMETALTKLQLLNNIPLDPQTVSPELQALMDWGMVLRCKSGYLNTTTDPDSGLTVSIFAWDTDGMLYEDDKSVKIEITFAAGATGGQAPYTITVRKSLSARGGEVSGDVVTSPFSQIWAQESEGLYLFATATDAAGNTVTAVTPFRYTMPARYIEDLG